MKRFVVTSAVFGIITSVFIAAKASEDEIRILPMPKENVKSEPRKWTDDGEVNRILDGLFEQAIRSNGLEIKLNCERGADMTDAEWRAYIERAVRSVAEHYRAFFGAPGEVDSVEAVQQIAKILSNMGHKKVHGGFSVQLIGDTLRQCGHQGP